MSFQVCTASSYRPDIDEEELMDSRTEKIFGGNPVDILIVVRW